MTIITDERCLDYGRLDHPERAARIASVLARLRSQKTIPIEWAAPGDLDPAVLERAHSPAHLANVRAPAGDYDTDTPGHPGIYDHALRSAAGAVHAMRAALQGRPAFSIMRPPGHHAARDRASGFCYFNSAAIAAMEARAAGVERVAVLDFDVHHGNGTEDLLLDQPGMAFFSVHQFPSYPGTGGAHAGTNCFNYPVELRAPRTVYRDALAKALDDLAAYQPGLVAISAGFDAHERDPVGEECLETEDFHWLGERIRALDAPAFSILEGGYSEWLPDLVMAYLAGWTGH